MKIKYSYLPFLISLALLMPLGIKIGTSSEKIERVSVLGTGALFLAFSIIFAFMVVLVAVCHFSYDSSELCTVKQNAATAISSILVGSAIFVYTLSEVGTYLISFKIDAFTALYLLSGIAASIVFLCYGIATSINKDIFNAHSYLTFLPVLWGFLYFMYVQNTTDRKSHLGAFGAVLFVGFFVLSILYQNKILSKFFKGQKTRSKEALFVFSLPGVLCCLLFTVMDIAKHVTSGSGVFGNYLKNILDLSISLHTISFMLSLKPLSES